MIYPAIIIFGMMALSGFWLIYSLTDDVHELAINVDPKMEHNLALMAKNIARLTDSVESMTHEVKSISSHISNMDKSTFTMQKEIERVAILCVGVAE